MRVIQDMTDKELHKARSDAFTQTLLGADNEKAIEAFDIEIERRKRNHETNCD